jgi:heme a synthase
MTNFLSNLSPRSWTGADPALPSPITDQAMQTRFAIAVLTLAGCTLCLMALGSATRVMNAGLSCPDWPLCYGGLLPRSQMNLQVFLEWFHRLVAASVGFGIIAVSAGALRWRAQLPQWLPGGMGLALSLVIGQGVLGGLTVTQLLRFDIVTAHLGTGLAFFGTLLTIGLLLIHYPAVANLVAPRRSIGWLGAIAAGFVYLQSLLGGLVASQWAVHQCYGRAQLCGVMNRHIFGVIPATIAVVSLLGWAFWTHRQTPLHPWLIRCGLAIATLLTVQIGLGVTTFRLHLQVEVLTVLHQAVGAALLGTLLAATVFALRPPMMVADQPSVMANNGRSHN